MQLAACALQCGMGHDRSSAPYHKAETATGQEKGTLMNSCRTAIVVPLTPSQSPCSRSLSSSISTLLSTYQEFYFAFLQLA